MQSAGEMWRVRGTACCGVLVVVPRALRLVLALTIGLAVMLALALGMALAPAMGLAVMLALAVAVAQLKRGAASRGVCCWHGSGSAAKGGVCLRWSKVA